MNTLRNTYALTMMFLKPTMREPMLLILVSLLPLSFFLVFFLIGGKALSTQVLMGILVVFMVNVGIIQLPQLSVTYKVRQLQEMYIASPAGPVVYAASLGLSRLAYVSPGVLSLLAYLLYDGVVTPAMLPATLLILAVAWFIGVLMGFTISLLVSDIYKVSMVANLVGMLFSVLPPVYYPLNLVPTQWQWVAMIIPTTHAAQLLRAINGLAESSLPMMTLHGAALAVTCLICLGIVTRRMKWQEV